MDAWLSDKKTIQRSKRYYAHFDVRTDIGRMKDYVSNPKAVAAHGFYPFIHYEMNMSKFKRGKGVVPKKRDICYAAHIDRCIYQYYSHILNEKYNERTTCDGISNVAVAYRTNLRKSNIQFSKAAYDFIRKTENCYVMIGDFTHFFDNLDHAYLKKQWCSLLECERLPKDHYNVFKNITSFSQWELTDLLAINELKDNKAGHRALNKRSRVLTAEQYAEHLQARWQRKPTKDELQPIANIISWNLWQMDGLHLSVPGGKPQPETEQLDLFSIFGAAEPQPPTVSCKVKNWRKGSHGTAQNFETIQEGSTSMKFDYVIGNPPYQISDGGAGVSATPIYNRFIEAIKTTHPGAICLIIPAKWYSGGKGLDKFREEMLGDRHISTLVDYSNSLDVFPNVDVAGGVCYFVWKEAYNGKCKYTNYRNGKATTAFLILQIAMTQQLSKASFAFVPCQDFTRKWTDKQLFEKYDLSSEEVNYIQGMIKEMA